MIQVERVSKSYNGRKVLEEIGFGVKRGEFFGVIGPNGSGKSTLVRLLSAVERADSGEVRLDRKAALTYGRRDLAQWLAVLQQESLPPVGFTVREVVEMGRFPHQNWLGGEKSDIGVHAIVDSIIDQLGLAELQHRSLDELSGGERQRVALGKTMAQQPKLLMLDEPTTYLDIGHQIQLMEHIRAWQREAGMTVVAVLHDLNLASLYCDRILMLDKGRVVRVGTPGEIVQGELIEEVYGIRPVVVEHPVNGAPQIMLTR